MSRLGQSENWVVQMEGMMLKRGAGYEVNAEKSRRSALSFLFRRKATLIRGGSAEKKRYFCLVTMAPEGDQPPRAELRYFTRKMAPESTPKGVVTFRSDMRVELAGHSTVCLVTRGRTYYLRPDKAAGDPSSAQARVTAGKWMYAFDFAINGLAAWMLAGTSDVGLIAGVASALSPEEARRAGNRSSLGSVASMTTDFSQPAALAEGGDKRHKLQASAERFAGLWDSFGLHGYNAVVAHYGPVLIDVQRMRDHLMVRVKMIQAELALAQQQTHRSQDVAANEQKATAKVLFKLYTGFESDADELQKHHSTLMKEVIKPIDQLMAKINEELDAIVSFHHSTAKSIERVYSAVNNLKENIRELQAAQATGPRERAKSFAARKPAQANLERDPAEIAADLRAAQEMLGQCKQSLRSEEAKHAARMKLALRSLHALEIERLGRQAQVLKKLVQLEKALYAKSSQQASLIASIEAVDPVLDVQATADRLMGESVVLAA